ncbi:MAG: arylsulfatase [Saprospiraceae bacterium]
MKWILCCVVIGYAFFISSCNNKNNAPPNILLILADDQGYGDLAIHGNRVIETPTLDALAKESARFEKFYVSPLCAPTRASLLTGRYHLSTGVVSVSKGMEIMRTGEETIAEMCKANGYVTGMFGKWHNGQHMPNHPNGQGFDEFFGFCGGHWSNYFNTDLEENGEIVHTKGYISDVLTNKAIEFIDQNKTGPFLCYMAYNTPHTPHQVPDKYFDKYKAKGLNDELACIYGMVENMDENINRLLTKLKNSGLDKNTIVIYLSDNGPNGVRYNDDMKGIKGSVDEGGVRVPCFWRWPGKITPHTIHAMSAHIDVMPTLKELCNLNFNNKLPMDGVSLATLLMNKKEETVRHIFYSHVAQPQIPIRDFPAAVREDSILLVLKENEQILYNLKNDPSQLNNIIATNGPLAEKLKRKYDVWWQRETKDLSYEVTIPLDERSKRVELPGYEASFTGNIKYYEGHGWAHDWLTSWISKQDSIIWEVESLEDQNYSVFMQYTCPLKDIGSEVQLSLDSQIVSAKITEAFDPPFLPSPDRVKRKEAYEKPWKSLKMGDIHINKGKHRLILKAQLIAGQSVADLNSIELMKK